MKVVLNIVDVMTEWGERALKMVHGNEKALERLKQVEAANKNTKLQKGLVGFTTTKPGGPGGNNEGGGAGTGSDPTDTVAALASAGLKFSPGLAKSFQLPLLSFPSHSDVCAHQCCVPASCSPFTTTLPQGSMKQHLPTVLPVCERPGGQALAAKVLSAKSARHEWAIATDLAKADPSVFLAPVRPVVPLCTGEAVVVLPWVDNDPGSLSWVEAARGLLTVRHDEDGVCCCW